MLRPESVREDEMQRRVSEMNRASDVPMLILGLTILCGIAWVVGMF